MQLFNRRNLQEEYLELLKAPAERRAHHKSEKLLEAYGVLCFNELSRDGQKDFLEEFEELVHATPETNYEVWLSDREAEIVELADELDKLNPRRWYWVCTKYHIPTLYDFALTSRLFQYSFIDDLKGWVAYETIEKQSETTTEETDTEENEEDGAHVSD